MKVKRKLFLIIAAAIVLFSSAGIIYLNKVILPTEIKSLIVQGLEGATQERVSLGSVQFNIFKGLVLRDLTINEGPKALIRIKEGSCTFLFFPIFKKNLIFPSIKLVSPEVFLERFSDNTLNLAHILPKAKEKKLRQEFNLIINKVTIINARINFQDDTLSSPFSKTLDSLNGDIFFGLPNNIRFNLTGGIAANPRIELGVSGVFNIASKRLISKLSVKNLSPQELSAYYKDFGISFQQGLVDCLGNLEFKDGLVSVNATAKIYNLILSRGSIKSRVNLNIAADTRYDLKENKLFYQGDAEFNQTDISGLDAIGGISDIRGRIHFDNNGLSSERLLANVAGLPLEIKLSLSDFSSPVINLRVSNFDLNSAQKALENRFKQALPVKINGSAGMFIAFDKKAGENQPMRINGYLDVLNAAVKSGEIASTFEDIKGRIEFNMQGLEWKGINFKYQGLPYIISGTLTDFAHPHVQFSLSSAQLSLESGLIVNAKQVEIERLKGKYLNSEFSLCGKIELSNPKSFPLELSGVLDIDLKDMNIPFKKFSSELERAKPAGAVQVKFDASGDINDFKSMVINAQALSSSLSVYGLKTADFFLEYKQAGGVLRIPSMRISLYDGAINANAAMNFNSKNLPYRLELDIKDIKLEKLKLDTSIKDKEIAGIVQAQATLNGFSNDISKLSGQGDINIRDGKLWQLNLFQGMGKLIFGKDFANIIFNEGQCSFVIKDKAFFTDSLKLKSNLAELSGCAKINFDSAIDASIEVHVLDQMAPLTSTFKDVATAIVGKSDKFGMIKISGTLAQPKYKFQPSVIDIIKGLKDCFLGNNSKN